MNSLFLIIFSPFIGSCLAGLFPQKIGRKGVGLITISLITLAMILAFFFFLFSIQMENEIFITCFPWINSGNFFCAWGFQFDTLTAIMLLVVTSISLGVHIYSFEYMSHDAHLPRFFF
jgi:NADH-quinone oxidoreductase subunit L